MKKKLLIIDNYDSFTYNLLQLFAVLDVASEIYRNDALTVDQARKKKPDYLLISPGPGTPDQAGISIPMIRAFTGHIPILGVCLGMQCLNEAFGGQTVRSTAPRHGQTSRVKHHGRGIFAKIPSPFTAARYHSLICQPAENHLSVSATTEAPRPVVMGLDHPEHPVFGVQFHPESFLSEHGRQLAENFLAAAG